MWQIRSLAKPGGRARFVGSSIVVQENRVGDDPLTNVQAGKA
jgi:hypothetical protein